MVGNRYQFVDSLIYILRLAPTEEWTNIIVGWGKIAEWSPQYTEGFHGFKNQSHWSYLHDGTSQPWHSLKNDLALQLGLLTIVET